MPQPLVATFFRPHTGNVPRTVILGYREGLPPPRAPHHQYNGRVLAKWNPNPNATTRSFATRSQFALTLHEEVVNAPSLLQRKVKPVEFKERVIFPTRFTTYK